MDKNYGAPHCVLFSPVTSYLLDPNILLNTLFSEALNLCKNSHKPNPVTLR